MKTIGLDIGSTTIKCVVFDDNDTILFQEYKRHFSQITQSTAEMLDTINQKFKDSEYKLCISGSAGMGIATALNIPFVQEVYATRLAVKRYLPKTDAVIELGGEDAKILFLSDQLEVRMNGTCAGGTGAFIDQMATLLNITPTEMNEIAKEHEKIYTIASRCGVFAKSDIQPLLNQGARKSDISASIFYAVVNQTIAGLAQGREIKGNIVYLGGPLTYFSELRNSFDDTLKLTGTCPENSLYFVAIGAALSEASDSFNISELIKKVESYKSSEAYNSCPPLFNDEQEFNEFRERHRKNSENIKNTDNYEGEMFLGIDAGSTTVKTVVINKSGDILTQSYMSNNGNPVPFIKQFLTDVYSKYPGIKIASSAVTGYGEEIIKNAFRIDFGIVETIAHYTAAKKFRPDVDFIIDIGGQDIKCFKIRNNTIDNIFLNEACSSGCGSFLQTFAAALNYSIEDFANLGLFAKKPVDLGSRCTVFMNSSVKQAQKDGAAIEDISAGLSISVVKNALYKVIRATNAESLGKHIVVQGGTFLNNAVLRAFEQEVETEVVRPEISGLMGAYGAALYASEKYTEQSSILNAQELAEFKHDVKAVTCKGCSNHCKLTVNTFDGGRKFIGGNRCEKALNVNSTKKQYNMYEYNLSLLDKYRKAEITPTRKEVIGIPMGLNMYELLPFWHKLFTTLGFKVVASPPSNRKLYIKGQHTIPSDTVCFPAKLLHGHIEELIEAGCDTIFYPCMSYNIDEHLGDNHYNCPVVAYYPEVIKSNVKAIENIKFICDYVGIHRPKDFAKKFYDILCKYFDNISWADVKKAVELAYNEYDIHLKRIEDKAAEFLEIAQKENMPVIILAGRPYHIDPEICHGIDKLICSLGAVVLTERSISSTISKFPVNVLNQWTYHSRLFASAKYICDNADKNINLVQLVSFGCGVDAITTDEVRSILESNNKIYTQIKIDEITNLGAVKIRLRSLFAATE